MLPCRWFIVGPGSRRRDPRPQPERLAEPPEDATEQERSFARAPAGSLTGIIRTAAPRPRGIAYACPPADVAAVAGGDERRSLVPEVGEQPRAAAGGEGGVPADVLELAGLDAGAELEAAPKLRKLAPAQVPWLYKDVGDHAPGRGVE